MSKRFVPTNVKRLRGTVGVVKKEIKSMHASPNMVALEKSYEYLFKMIKKLVISEKYILDPHMLVMDVRPETDKLLLKRALGSITSPEGNKVIKITSAVYKPVHRTFRNSVGKTSLSKRVYVRFDKHFDHNLLISADYVDAQNDENAIGGEE